MKQCVKCLQWKDESEFNWRYQAPGIRHVTCHECLHGHGDDWCQKYNHPELEIVKTGKHGVKEEAREYASNYLATHPCTMCGESDPKVLGFHYTGGKGWIVSNLVGGGNVLTAIQAEIAKCVVLCANCRRKISNAQLKQPRSKNSR